MVTIYGIKNCDTMKKAFSWLAAQDIAYDFHDYKKQGISEDKLTKWCQQAGWEALLNKRGTTFRKLPDTDKQDIDEARAISLMVANPSMVKRPVLEVKDKLLVGFKADEYEAVFA